MKNYQPIILSNKPEPNPKKEDQMEDYIPEARNLLMDAADDIGAQSEAILTIVNRLIQYDNAVKMMKYLDSLAAEFKIKKGDFNTAIKQVSQYQSLTKDDTESSSLICRVEAFISKNYELYFNVVANRFMCREKGASVYKELNIDNIYRELKKSHINYSISDIRSLMKSDYVPRKNAFEEYFNNLPEWDGVDHIEQLSRFIHVQEISKDSQERIRFVNMFIKMLVRSVACSLEVDFNKHCFTVVHEKQSSGKTTFMRWLCPPQLEDYYTENIGTNKDDLIALTENFIVNMDELSTLSKYDINALKSVMSKHRVKVRLPYGDRPEILQRRCNFVASTNRLEFLNDETGSVRWICFLLDRIDWDYNKKIDINKVWTQAYHLFKNTSFNYQLTPEEILENEESNKTFLIRSPEMELIQTYLMPGDKGLYESAPEKMEFMTATGILTYLNEKNRSNIRLTNVNVGKSLKMLGFSRDTHYESEQGMSLKGYFVIYKENQERFGN
jgi:predicted P-loop ATPase